MFDKLVASQPTGDNMPDDNVMENGDSSAPQDDADGSTHKDTSTPIDNVDGKQGQEDDAKFKAMQKRIDKLTAKSKGAEEDKIKSEAKLEAYESMRKESQPQTIQDLDVNGLTSFIAKAEGDPDLEQHLPEAKLELQKRLIDDRFSAFEEKQLAQNNDQRFQTQTNGIISALSGDRLNDESSEYYGNAMSFMADLDSEAYSGINVKQVLAVALAENERLKSEAKGPTMSDRVKFNRNDNTLQSNNRASNGNNSDDLNTYLKEAGPLSRSNQVGSGSLKEAISRLNTVRSFGGEN